MKAAIVGYGRMGPEIHQALANRGHEVVSIVDPVPSPTSSLGDDAPARFTQVTPDALKNVDVAIEFSLADAVKANAKQYCATGVAAVIGTTGWAVDLPEIQRLYGGSSAGAVHGSNFSIGAQIFFRVASYAASLVQEIEDYDLLIHEMHHRLKADSPSGTALSLAERVMRAAPRKDTIETGRLDRAPAANELHVSSSRGGSIPGTHTLYLDSAADTIEVRHQARSRGGFALGAVLAAEWIVGKQGLFTIEDFVSQLLESKS